MQINETESSLNPSVFILNIYCHSNITHLNTICCFTIYIIFLYSLFMVYSLPHPHSHSQEEGRLSLIEQNELYTLNSDPNQDFLNPHKDTNFLSRLSDITKRCTAAQAEKPIVQSLREANLPESTVKAFLEGREQGINQLPRKIKTVLHHNQANAFREAKLLRMASEAAGGKVAEINPLGNDVPSISEILAEPSSVLTENVSPILPPATSNVASAISPIATAMVTPPNQVASVSPVAAPVDGNNFGSMFNISFTTPVVPTAQQAKRNSYTTNSAVPTARVQPIPRAPPPSRVTQEFDLKSNNTDKMPAKTSIVNSSSLVATTTPNYPGYVFNPPPLSSGIATSSVSFPSSYPVEPISTYSQMPGVNQGGNQTASNGATNMFGQMPTQHVPNFTGNTFQNNPIPIPNQSGMGYNFPVQEGFTFQNTNPSGGINPTVHFNSTPGVCDQNQNGDQNGDQILENLLKEVNEVEPRCVDVGSTYGHNQHYMRDELTMSGTCQVTGGVSMYQGGVANEMGAITGGNADVLEILSQFI